MHACCVHLIRISLILFILLLFVAALALEFVENIISKVIPTVGTSARAREAVNRPTRISGAEYDGANRSAWHSHGIGGTPSSPSEENQDPLILRVKVVKSEPSK